MPKFYYHSGKRGGGKLRRAKGYRNFRYNLAFMFKNKKRKK